ncbi:DeoR/GlpR family DNA-binding transcription regulator [Paenibacillus sp. MZ04-78.2]|uniref:DeoR/GlpR family DNA-binding transcription regulator n=1 Tax=Paenibacillus sp. MZ04-78.2 TaxID=2962034 RepID=UPI0020B82759|nr:DeoR/GlpR family DNA-binding transcription regulator [Paenibacillus sp. MZ04-78.2]MCP3773563.1 DeoR/GlpR family DNA-binding transcription regulator [Paenibacillus sp. MZ04-78.2]
MFQEERLIAILQKLNEKQRITVTEICEWLQISWDTARRDLIKLEEQGSIIRTRGGAMLPSITKEVPNYEQRLQLGAPSKEAIGRLVGTLIHDGDYLYADSSTTVRCAMESMRTRRNVVVTNSIDLAGMLTQKDEIRIHLLGGLLDNEQRLVYGARTLEMLSEYQVDKALLGTCGISSHGLTTMFEEESYLIRQIMRKSDQVIVLADHTKFGKKLFHRVAGLEGIDIIVTDREPSDEMKEELHKHQVELLITGEGEHHD